MRFAVAVGSMVIIKKTLVSVKIVVVPEALTHELRARASTGSISSTVRPTSAPQAPPLPQSAAQCPSVPMPDEPPAPGHEPVWLRLQGR